MVFISSAVTGCITVNTVFKCHGFGTLEIHIKSGMFIFMYDVIRNVLVTFFCMCPSKLLTPLHRKQRSEEDKRTT